MYVFLLLKQSLILSVVPDYVIADLDVLDLNPMNRILPDMALGEVPPSKAYMFYIRVYVPCWYFVEKGWFIGVFSDMCVFYFILFFY